MRRRSPRLFLLVALPLALQASPAIRLALRPLAESAELAIPFSEIVAALETHGGAVAGPDLWTVTIANGGAEIAKAGGAEGAAEIDAGAGILAIGPRTSGLAIARLEQGGDVTLWSLPVEAGRAQAHHMARIGSFRPTRKPKRLGIAASAGLAGEVIVTFATDGERTDVVAVDSAGHMVAKTELAGETLACAAVGRGHVLLVGRLPRDETIATLLPLALFRPYRLKLPEELPGGIANALLLTSSRRAAALAVGSSSGGTWILQAEENPLGGDMSAWDIVVLVAYLAGVAAIGVVCARRISNGRDMFLGGGRVPGWAGGLSIVLTNISAISFIALPSRAFATDSTMLLFLFTPVVAAPIVLKFIAPMLRRGAYVTAYEVLGARFGQGFRRVGSWLFCAYEIGRIGVLLVVPAILISMITGIPELWCIVTTAAFTIVYTAIGGFEAVVWTDVFQSGVLFLALLATPLLIFSAMGSMPAAVETAFEAGKFRLIGTSSSLGGEGWLVLILSLVTSANSYLWHQPTVQRLLSARDERAVRSTVISAAVSSPLLLALMFFGGAMLYSFYAAFPERMAIVADSRDEIFASFIVHELPPGVGGLVVAAIFATSMSSLSGAINSLTAVLASDLVPSAQRKALLGSRRFSRWATAICGGLGALVAVFVAMSGAQSLFDLFIEFTNLLSGSLAGVFVLALFGGHFRPVDAWVGFALSIAAVAAAKASGTMSFMLYGTLGTVVCIAGAALSRLCARGRTAPSDPASEPASLPQSTR